MKKKKNGFSAVFIMIGIVAIAVLGLAGWLVYQRANDNDESANSSDVQYDGVEIFELGIKVKEPETRAFSVAKVELASVIDEETTEVFALTPSDYPAEYSSICEHPAHIYQSIGSDDSLNTVKVGDKNYYVGKTILGCGGSEEMSIYLEELHTYIIENIESI